MGLPKLIDRAWLSYNRYFLSEKQTNEFDLNWKLNPIHSYNKLSKHKFTKFEIFHYSFLSLVCAFVFVVIPIHFLLKFLLFSTYIALISIPVTSQFFLNAMPILTWVFLFFSSSQIPASWKPPISVQVLPATETIFYGDNLSNILAATKNSFLDVLALGPYGLIHFSFPFVLAAMIWFFGPPLSLRSYAMAFGYMNLIGVIIQNLFPSAPPWYKIIHGLNPADYSMPGCPGGLGRIDDLLGFDMYTTTFENSPLVFGAFPSLHSGSATMEALFLSWLFPKATVFAWGYVALLWWCTMYLAHHYFIDLIAGSCLSVVVFSLVRYTILPVTDKNKFCRFSYTKIDYLRLSDVDNYSYNHVPTDEEFQMTAYPQTLSGQPPAIQAQASGQITQQAASQPPLQSAQKQQQAQQQQQQQQQQAQQQQQQAQQAQLQQQQQQKLEHAIRSRSLPLISNSNSTTTSEEENRSSNSSLFEVDINLNSSTTSLSSMSGSTFSGQQTGPSTFKQ